MQYTEQGEPYLPPHLRPVIADRAPPEPQTALARRVQSLRVKAGNPSLDEIERTHGPGTRLYFSFLKCVACFNAVLALCGVVSWAMFLNDPRKTWSFVWTDFFVANYLRPYSDAYVRGPLRSLVVPFNPLAFVLKSFPNNFLGTGSEPM